MSKQDDLAPRTEIKFIEEDKHFSGRYSKNVFETILFSYKPFLPRLALVLFVGIFARTLLLLNANVMGYWADSLCGNGPACKPLPHFFQGFGHVQYVGILLGLVGLGFVLNTSFRVTVARLGTHAVSMLYDEVTVRTSRLPMGFFDRTPVGRIISRFSSDYGAVFRMAGGPMGEFLCLLFDLVLMLILTSVASPFYIPLVLATVVINGLVYRMNLVRLRRERRNQSISRAPAIAHFAETAQGARTVKAFGRQGVFAHRFAQLIDASLLQRVRAILAIQAFSLQMTATTSFLLLATGVLGLFLVSHELVSVGSLAVAFTFVMMTSSTIQQFFEYLAQIEEAMTGVERLDDYLRRDLELGGRLPPQAQFATAHARAFEPTEEQKRNLKAILKLPREGGESVSKMPSQASITLENVVLRYRSDLPVILKNISVHIQAGEHVGVIGRTGSGKSSLIQALFLLYPLEKGRILVNNAAAEIFEGGTQGLTVELFRSWLALIPQDPALFRASLRENLVALDAGHSDEQLIQTLRQVGLGPWFAELAPASLDFAVEEKGANLSAGQRQLVCMARCLLQNAPIVVMDEATSAVDPVSEELLNRATREFLREKTQIIVAHRLPTIEHCDRILWFDNGSLVMEGTPAEVLPRFRAARKAQVETEQKFELQAEHS